MSDNLILKDIFSGIDGSLDKIIRRFTKINSAVGFVKDDWGQDQLDSISMRLQFIGESIKKVEKISPEFLKKYPQTDWNKIINLRDFISHHYDMLNHEIIFDICSQHIPNLKKQVEIILRDLSHSTH